MIEYDSRSLKLPHSEYERIETIVVKMYMGLSIKRVPIDPYQIAIACGFRLQPYSTLNDEAGLLLRSKELEAVNYYDPILKTHVICYDDSYSYIRLRFTLMHEVGHILLGHREESDLARKMADYFVAYALAPSPLIYNANCEDYLEVADYFNISRECADICFQRYYNWLNYGGPFKEYECDLLDLFDQGSY